MRVGEEENTCGIVPLRLPQSYLWDTTLYSQKGNQNSTIKSKAKL